MRLIQSIVPLISLMLSFNIQAGGNAEDIQQLRNLLQPISSLSAQFKQQVTDADGFQLQQSEGLFQVAQPNNLRWIVEQPMPQQVISNGLTLWLYDPDLEQVIVQPFDASIESTPAILFSGDLTRLDSAYFIRQLSPDVFQLTPEQEGSLFSELQIIFVDQLPASISLTDSLEQVTRITFSDVRLNPSLPAALFEFEIPGDIDVINNDS
ncbi:MAG: outer membrane lipoprotein chaperone LolA [Porticoccaceae bacterium]|jgi:outer membrane lipoprotein carrier protein|nr:outer membrane lipoprotein chaperone LolA [Porticoccaceae bacterium]